MHRSLIAIAASVALIPATQLGAKPPKGAQDGSRMVCRELVVTGTRFTKRYCKTAAEWARIAEHARESFREAQSAPPVTDARGN